MKPQPFFIFVLLATLAGCSGGGGGGSSGASRDVEIAWSANRETAVNATGGGYRVYYASTPDFDLANAAMVDVPNAGQAQTPTRVVVHLPPGTHYIKITAYSGLNPAGSAPSSETVVAVR